MLPVAIVAGGLATRLGHLTQSTPKALIEVAGEPFLAHQLRLLKSRGARRAILCVGHLGDRIREFAGDGRRFGLEIEYSFDGLRLLGTGGALRRALPLLGEAFLVVYGDSYLPCDYRAVSRAFLDSSMLALMTVFRNEDRGDASNVEFQGGRIVRYDKSDRTPRMRHIDYGLGAFHAKAFEELGPDQAYDLASIYQDLLRRDQLAGYEIGQRFYEIGSASGIQELEAHLAGTRRRAVFPDRGRRTE
jgi:NDP-sugar pyrophosphorylase family protein